MTDKDKVKSIITTLKNARKALEGLEELTMIEFEKVRDEELEDFIEGSKFTFNMIKEMFADEKLESSAKKYVELLKQKESVNDENN